MNFRPAPLSPVISLLFSIVNTDNFFQQNAASGGWSDDFKSGCLLLCHSKSIGDSAKQYSLCCHDIRQVFSWKLLQ